MYEGHSCKVLCQEINTSGKTWYLSHHSVYHPYKLRKIRVVLDLSEDYKGRFLNREMLSGPALTNQKVVILLRSRHDQVAVMGGIRAMFHQVKVPKRSMQLNEVSMVGQ